MVELLKEIETLRKQIDEARKELGPASDEDRLESRIQSVYGSLAIEEPDVTIDEVRRVLSPNP